MSKSLFVQKPDIESVDSLFTNQFSIPVFQRPYSWEDTEINDFFKDIADYFFNKRDEELFIGTVYLSLKHIVKSNINHYELIDGQQRITTLSLTFLLLYHYALLEEKGDDDSVKQLKKFLWKIGDSRESDRNMPLLTSSGIEKKIIHDIFDHIYNHAAEKDCLEGIYNYAYDNKLEERILKNFKTIDRNIKEIISKDNILVFIDFLIYNLKFITIIVDRENIKKLFEIFESINSKGKHLDQIDLIKSYIFQNIDGSDYDEYLNLWGELIKDTEDNLEDYMYVYIRAFIRYYRNSISIKYFKTLEADFKSFYKKDTLSDALKAHVDDLFKKRSLYSKINNKNDMLFPGRNEYVFYNMCLDQLDYRHPKPLLFRTYSEYYNGSIEYEDVLRIVKAAFVYMFTFQTISKRDSKDAIDVFEDIMRNIYQNGFDTDAIIASFRNSLLSEGVNKDKIKEELRSFSSYGDAGRVLLTAYEFANNNKVIYDKGIHILRSSKDIQIDHILPQNPNPSDVNFYYYCDNSVSPACLRLKPGHDFDQVQGIYDGMDYELFKNQILNRIGNLKLMWGSENRNKSNNLIQFKDYHEFHTYSQIANRSEEMIKQLLDSEILNLPE